MKSPLGPITPQTRQFLAQQSLAHLGARCIPATSSAFLNSCRRSPIAVAVGQEVTQRPCLLQVNSAGLNDSKARDPTTVLGEVSSTRQVSGVTHQFGQHRTL
jgi:hypothetical protein